MKYCIQAIFGLLSMCFINAQSINEEADNLYARGNYTKAIKAYKSLAKSDQVYNKVAKAYMAIGNYGEALANYKMQ